MFVPILSISSLGYLAVATASESAGFVYNLWKEVSKVHGLPGQWFYFFFLFTVTSLLHQIAPKLSKKQAGKRPILI